MRRLLLSLLLTGLLTSSLRAQAPPSQSAQVLMLSDFHFDPFSDPGIVAQLTQTDPLGWAAIMASKHPVGNAAKGRDTDYPLLVAALATAKARLPDPVFVTVSGDLITHNFEAGYYNACSNGNCKGTLADFAANTVRFVALQLHDAFPKSPIYLSLGNNDSPCTDYQEDQGTKAHPSAFFDQIAGTFAQVALDPANSGDFDAFPLRGDYAVTLPPPFQDTRLIVLQDLFQKTHFVPCTSGGAPTAAADQIQWLTAQLDAAKGKHVWVMAHMPPGTDPYSTYKHADPNPGAACRYNSPTMVLSDALGDLLANYTDRIQLVLLGHTHMDEMRVYLASSGGGAIPARLNPSITPWTGNKPSFTVATVDPSNAVLKDFAVYVAPNLAGTGTWSKKPDYTYSTAYATPGKTLDYSGAAVASLISAFQADTAGTSTPSRRYQSYYHGSPLINYWPVYTCALSNDTAASFIQCACPTH